jgi:hypothetical protein
MPKLLHKLVDRMELWALRGSEVTRLDGIGLSDLRGHPASFRQTIECSLRLIRENDARRYARVRREIRWIVNRVTGENGASYCRDNRTLSIEFTDRVGETEDIRAALNACIIVHEATHGTLLSRGIAYKPHNRVHIERLCVAEQNRFAAKLAAGDPERYPANLLHEDFRAGYWHSEWTGSRLKRAFSYLSRRLADR